MEAPRVVPSRSLRPLCVTHITDANEAAFSTVFQKILPGNTPVQPLLTQSGRHGIACRCKISEREIQESAGRS